MIDTVIVNWNSGFQLQNCIESLSKFDPHLMRGITVVDNASCDNSSAVCYDYSNVRLLRTEKNLGFGKACNVGAENSLSDFILFLNPDAAVYAGTIENTLNFMKDPKNSDVGVCGVQLIDDFGHVSRSCSRFPNILGFLSHSVGLEKIFPRLGHVMSEWPHDVRRDVDQVIGAFFFVRRHLFEKLGGFDERFFVYYEEVDFSYRARQAGWRSMYLADVQAFHAGGGTSNQVKARRLFYSLRSRLLYAFKHFSFVGAVLVLLSTLFIEPISRSALAIARRSWTSLKETWQGYGMLWQWLPQWWFKGITR